MECLEGERLLAVYTARMLCESLFFVSFPCFSECFRAVSLRCEEELAVLFQAYFPLTSKELRISQPKS